MHKFHILTDHIFRKCNQFHASDIFIFQESFSNTNWVESWLRHTEHGSSTEHIAYVLGTDIGNLSFNLHLKIHAYSLILNIFY
jgi:hypothetical protein